jgi:hypothetical protein
MEWQTRDNALIFLIPVNPYGLTFIVQLNSVYLFVTYVL